MKWDSTLDKARWFLPSLLLRTIAKPPEYDASNIDWSSKGPEQESDDAAPLLSLHDTAYPDVDSTHEGSWTPVCQQEKHTIITRVEQQSHRLSMERTNVRTTLGAVGGDSSLIFTPQPPHPRRRLTRVWVCHECGMGPLGLTTYQVCHNCQHARCVTCDVYQVMTR